MADKKTNPVPGKPAVVKQPGAKAVALPGKAARAAAKEEPSKGLGYWVEQGVQFLREVKTELKKVTWPPRKQTVASTGVVLGLVAIISLFLGLVDYVLTHFVKLLIS